MTTDDVVSAEWLEVPADEPPNVPAKYSVTDAASANWLVRRIVETRSYADRVRAWAVMEVRRAEREEQFFLHQYGRQLEQWTRTEIETLGGRRRSICLPRGTVGFRRSRARLLICNEAELLRWCHSHLVDALPPSKGTTRLHEGKHLQSPGTGQGVGGSRCRPGREYADER